MKQISLEYGWYVEYFEGADEPVAQADFDSLADWRGDCHAGRVAWLRHVFSLWVSEACVRYWLVADSVPAGASLMVNRAELGEVSDNFRLDVTDFVMLEDNVIGVYVSCDAVGEFVGLRLEQVLCDD